MPQIDIPGAGVLSFPDDMHPDQIKQIVTQQILPRVQGRQMSQQGRQASKPPVANAQPPLWSAVPGNPMAPAQSTTEGILRGVGNIASQAFTPQGAGLGLLGAATIAQPELAPLTTGIFAGMGAKGLGQAAGERFSGVPMTPGQKSELDVNMGVNSLMMPGVPKVAGAVPKLFTDLINEARQAKGTVVPGGPLLNAPFRLGPQTSSPRTPVGDTSPITPGKNVTQSSNIRGTGSPWPPGYTPPEKFAGRTIDPNANKAVVPPVQQTTPQPPVAEAPQPQLKPVAQTGGQVNKGKGGLPTPGPLNKEETTLGHTLKAANKSITLGERNGVFTSEEAQSLRKRGDAIFAERIRTDDLTTANKNAEAFYQGLVDRHQQKAQNATREQQPTTPNPRPGQPGQGEVGQAGEQTEEQKGPETQPVEVQLQGAPKEKLPGGVRSVPGSAGTSPVQGVRAAGVGRPSYRGMSPEQKLNAQIFDALPKVKGATGAAGTGGEAGSIFPKTGDLNRGRFGPSRRAQEERFGEAPEPGDWPEVGEALATGRRLKAQGTDPEKVLANFLKDPEKMISSDTVGVVFAHGVDLAEAANRATDEFGVTSPEARAAEKAELDWSKWTQELKTESGKILQSWQGQVDLDMGSPSAMIKELRSTIDKEPTDAQRGEVEKMTKENREADAKVALKWQELQQKLDSLSKALKEEQARPKVSSKTGTQLLVEAAKHGFKGAGKAWQGLNTMFGAGSGHLGSGPVFNEQTWAAAKPMFEEAWTDAKASGKSLAEFAQFALDQWGEKVEPYITKFLTDNGEKPETKKHAVPSAEEIKVEPTAAAVRKAVTQRPAKSRGDMETAAVWEYAKRRYLEMGETDFDTIRYGISQDLGIGDANDNYAKGADEVGRILTRNASVKAISDEMYKAMDARRKLKQSATFWIQDQKLGKFYKAISMVPRVFFLDKIFGHGTVAMITHAGINVFNPDAWRTYFPSFLRQYKLAYSHAYHEKWVQNQLRKPNFTMWKRAGLKADPYRYPDDYQNVTIKAFFGKLNMVVGNYGFDALKDFRINRANQLWNQLPAELRLTKEGKTNRKMAQMIADSVNHATGIVHMPFREWSSYTFFAPRLEASRWAWMVGDPAKAAGIFKDWKTASPEQRAFAMSELKQKASVAGTYFAALMLNQGVLKMMGSNEQINLTDPKKSDFLAFKIAGHKVSVVGPMLGMVKLFAQLVHDARQQRGKLESLTPRGKEMYEDVGQYGRGKLSPMTGFGLDIVSQADYAGRPLPWSDDKATAYEPKLGYKEYLGSTFSPIPVEEAIKEVWDAQGMDAGTVARFLRTLLLTGGTGVRVQPDVPPVSHQKDEIKVPGVHKPRGPKVLSRGDIIQRGEKNFQVVDYDTDGHPLVEPV